MKTDRFMGVLKISVLLMLTGQYCPILRAFEPVKIQSLPDVRQVILLNVIPATNRDGELVSVLIPLKQSGHLFLIEAQIDGQVGNFVFDTGADKLVLNKTYFRNNLRAVDEPGGGLTGGTRTIYKTSVDRVQVSELIFEDLQADVTELGQIENRRKVKILGLFGISLFADLELEIDLANGSLLLRNLDKKGVPVDPEFQPRECDYTGKLDTHKQILFVNGRIGGKTMDFCLDTGAETNVISSTAPKKALETVNISRRSEMTGVGGADIEVLYGTMTDFSLGELKFSPMQTIVANLTALSQAYDYPVGGILGFDFFDQGVICVNLVTKEIRVTLNERKEQ